MPVLPVVCLTLAVFVATPSVPPESEPPESEPETSPSSIATAEAEAAATEPARTTMPAEAEHSSQTQSAPLEGPSDAASAAEAAAQEAPPPRPIPVVPDSNYAAKAELKDARGLLWAGVSVAATTYVFTSLAGAVALDRARKLHERMYDAYGQRIDDPENRGAQRRRFGQALLVPVVGPFFAIPHADSAKKKWLTSMAGALQVGGVVMALVGGIRAVRARRARRWTLTASTTLDGATVGAHVRF